MTTRPTHEQILDLRDEAAHAGDPETVDACELALEGDEAALATVSEVLADARAMLDEGEA